MKTKSENLLPKTMPGTVHQQYIRCGKSNCKCSNGELHGPYFYHFERDSNGQLRKRYLKASVVERFQIACAARQEEEQKYRALRRAVLNNLRDYRKQLRDRQEQMNSERHF